MPPPSHAREVVEADRSAADVRIVPLFLQALSAAELGVAGYGDLTPYGALWDHHHHAPTYHHPHPADLLAAGFPADLWVGGANPQSHRMLPQR